MLCTQWTLVKTQSRIITAEPLRCRSWQCDHCRPIRRKRCINEAAHGEPATFITLTVNPAHLSSPDERAQALVSAWREVRRLAKKKWHYKTIPFYAVFERTKAGEPHLHILSRIRWLDQAWLSNVMKRLIGAPICDVRPVDKGRNPGRYIAKYIGKDLTQFAGVKRYWRSLDWLETEARRIWEDERPVCDIAVWKMCLYDAVVALAHLGTPLSKFEPETAFSVLRGRRK